MDRDQLEFIREHYEDLGVEVLSFARRCAVVKYALDLRDTVLGNSIEDVVGAVFDDYLMGARHLKPGVGILVQLKNAARSELWNLMKRKETKAAPIIDEGNEDEAPSVASIKSPDQNQYAAKERGPDTVAMSADECEMILKVLWEHPKVKASDELAGYLLAVEDGATTPAEIAQASQMPVERVYEARRSFIGLYSEIKRKLNL